MLDDLERALAAAEVHEEAQLEEGVRLVHRSLASVLDVVQKGYKLGERVVRPARVVVAAAPTEREGDG